MVVVAGFILVWRLGVRSGSAGFVAIRCACPLLQDYVNYVNMLRILKEEFVKCLGKKYCLGRFYRGKFDSHLIAPGADNNPGHPKTWFS